MPTIRSATKLQGLDFLGWATFVDGGVGKFNGTPTAGWDAPTRTPEHRFLILCVLVVEDKRDQVFCGAAGQTNTFADLLDLLRYFFCPLHRERIPANSSVSCFC